MFCLFYLVISTIVLSLGITEWCMYYLNEFVKAMGAEWTSAYKDGVNITC